MSMIPYMSVDNDLVKPYVGDVGTSILLDSGQPITDATFCRIEWTKPDGTIGTWGATVYSDGRHVRHVTAAGDLSVAGVWMLQAYVETPVWKGRGETCYMEVFNRFE